MDNQGRDTVQGDGQTTGSQSQSVLLSTLLDNAGLSTEAVAIKILTEIADQNILKVTDGNDPFKRWRRNSILGNGIPIDYKISCGSRAEGIAFSHAELPSVVSSACSDSDAQIVRKEIIMSDVEPIRILPIVVHDRVMPAKQDIFSTMNIAAVTSHHHSGYVDLYVYTRDAQPRHAMLSSEWQDIALRMVAPTYLMDLKAPSDKPITTVTIQGPACKLTWLGNSVADDVVCFHMSVWPNVAREWINRQRRFGWPSPRLVKAVVKRGCHVVPVGHPNSPKCSSEWRLSFSVAERTLVWSFNDSQRKCYFILKLLCKEIIGRANLIFDVVSSYHVKTLMFWMIEETEGRRWCKENLVSSLRLCLRRLLLWISEANVPSYFIPSNNLIDHKLTTEVQSQLCCVLDTILNDVWKFVQTCELIAKEYYAMESGHNLKAVQLDTISLPLRVYNKVIYGIMCEAIPYKLILNNQQIMLRNLKKTWPRVVMKYLIARVENNIGCLYHAQYKLSCAKRKPNYDLLHRAENIMSQGCSKLPAYGLLKLAHFYYSTGNLRKALIAFGECLDWIDANAMPPDTLITKQETLYREMSSVQIASDLSECYDNVETPKSRGWSRVIDVQYAHTPMHVVYTPLEIPCVDIPLVYQIVAQYFHPSLTGIVSMKPVSFVGYLIIVFSKKDKSKCS